MKINTIIRCFEAATRSEKNKTVGTVNWCSTPPPGVNYQTHKFMFIDALTTAVNMLWINHRDENPSTPLTSVWVKTGITGSGIATVLPQTVLDEDDHMRTEGLCYIGSIGNRPIFLDPKMGRDEFEVGDNRYTVKGTIVTDQPVTISASPIRSTEAVAQR